MSTGETGLIGVLKRRKVCRMLPPLKLGDDVVGFALSRVGYNPIHGE